MVNLDIDLNDIATLVAVIAGISGLILGIVNYLRDRFKITVELSWDMKALNVPDVKDGDLYGVIRITNIGRRPAYVSHVALKLPKGYEGTHLVIMEGLVGNRLEEGSQPLTYPVQQEGLGIYAKDWKKIRAEVSDSAGKKWRSPRIWRGKKPSWAKP